MMERLRQLLATPVVFALVYFPIAEPPEDFYIETGGLLIAWIAAGLVGGSVLVRIYWGKFKGLFGRFLGRKDGDQNDDSTEG